MNELPVYMQIRQVVKNDPDFIGDGYIPDITAKLAGKGIYACEQYIQAVIHRLGYATKLVRTPHRGRKAQRG